MDYLINKLEETGLSRELAEKIFVLTAAAVVILLCISVSFFTNKVILNILARYISASKHSWDKILFKRKVFKRLSHIVPAVILYLSAPIFNEYKETIRLIASTYILTFGVLIISAVLNSINDIYKNNPISRTRPIKGLLQITKILIFIIIGILIIANLMGESPWILLSGLGALTAVISLVFRDSILGFVAGIQLTSNDMLRIGDWIEIPKYGADGDVIDISLTTVKVQNFDKTITTVPAYALISDSFRNWRGMLDFGGRRIKRAVYIDKNSIIFCSKEMLEKFKKIQYLKDYLNNKEQEIELYNKENRINTELLINGRHLTNIGIFRRYIINYLKNHSGIKQDMIMTVRQLPPGEHGLPLEIYAFTNTVEWESYEEIQADIFDHILAVIKEFELRIFQNPSGFDFSKNK